MWMDIIILSICVLKDLSALPPSMRTIIMVILGNRKRMFCEALVVVFTLRFIGSAQELRAVLLFLNVFGAGILIDY
jgi:hypothetical protein